MSPKCPKCGTKLEFGFGLAGGGMGPYLYCPNDGDGCDYFEKFHEAEDEPASDSAGENL